MFLPVSVNIFVFQWTDYSKILPAIFMNPFRIINCCYGNNPLNFGVVSTQSGRLAAILDFCYHTLHMDHTWYNASSLWRRHLVNVDVSKLSSRWLLASEEVHTLMRAFQLGRATYSTALYFCPVISFFLILSVSISHPQSLPDKI